LISRDVGTSADSSLIPNYTNFQVARRERIPPFGTNSDLLASPSRGAKPSQFDSYSPNTNGCNGRYIGL
jgi:hypothetical protein